MRKLAIIYALCTFISLTKNIDEHEKVFTNIYNNAWWGKNAEGKGFSGHLSLFKNNHEFIAFLENFIKEHDIKTIVDAGCGDWEFLRHVDWQGAQYVGYDVVAHVIEEDIKRHASDTVTFVHGNCVTDDLPPADLLICKHVLQVLPDEDIMQFLKQLPKYKYCLLINQMQPRRISKKQKKYAIGREHHVDLAGEPLNLKGRVVMSYRACNSMNEVFLVKYN